MFEMKCLYFFQLDSNKNGYGDECDGLGKDK